MLQNNKRLIAHLIVLFLFSLLPFLWLKDGQAILGHDAGFPISPWEHFMDRLYVWSHRFGLGNDQTTEVGGFFIHGFEAVVDKLGFSLTQVQQITFSTYFFLFGVSMYIFAQELFPHKKKHLPLIAGLLYMYNHFILQAWFIVERTKFTLYIALPIVLTLVFRVVNNKINPFIAGIWASFTIFLLNGGGFFPLFGAVLITIPFIYANLIIFSSERRKTFILLLKFTVTWSIGTMLLCSFWLIPYFRFILTSFSSELGTAGGVSGVLAWVTTISENSSFYNLFRLQGIPEWYANPLHPYAQTFFSNTFLQIISYALPVLAFGSYLLAKGKEKVTVIMLFGLALFSMIFIAGSHPPFGFIYVWLIQNVPGFVAFRTPYYKFAPALWLAYSILIAYTVSYVLLKIRRESTRKIVLVSFAAVMCIYNYPLIVGNFFDYEVNKKTTKVTVPKYVFEYADWANSPDFPYKRLLLLPGQNPDTRFEAYTWGYWSLAQIQGLLNNQSYIGNSLYKADTEEIFIKNLYDLMEKGDSSWVNQAEYLFVDAILLRKDFDYTLENSPTVSPFELEKFLDESPQFTRVKEFGEWVVYEFQKNPQSFTFKDYFYEVQTQDKGKFFEPTSLPGVELDSRTIFLEQSIDELKNRRKGIVYIPWCVHCLLENKRIFEINRVQIVTAGSLFYNAQLARDESELASVTDQKDKLELAAKQSLKRMYQLQNQFFRQADVSERVIGLNEQVKSLNIELELLNKYTESLDEYSFEDNAFFEILYENTDQMLSELQIPMQEINQESEAALYIEIQNLINEIRDIVYEKLWYSEDNLTKKYFLEVSNPGEYELFIKKQTSNAFSSIPVDLKEIEIANNGSNYPVAIQTTDESPWAKLSTIHLDEGTNRIEIKEPLARSALGNNGAISLTFDDEHKCTKIPMPFLDRNSYILNFKARSDQDIDDLYIFIDEVGTNRPILPYRGTKFNITGERTSSLELKKLVLIPDNHFMQFCRLTNEPIKPHTLDIESMYIERISVPVIAFLKRNTEVLPPPSQLSIASKKINQTEYEVTVDGSGNSLLMFDQRHDSGWKFSENTFIKDHQRLHGYANGWHVSKNFDDKVTLTLKYISQNLLIIGWIITIVTGIGFAAILAKHYLKK